MSNKSEYQKQYKEINFIGKGNYGSAILVQKIDDQDSIFIAKKVMLSSMNKKELESAFQEVKLLKSLNHPNIVRYIDSFTEENELIIIMEYCEEGDLSYFIKTRAETGELLDEKVILNWFLQVCLALDCIHKQKILHRDIKSSNIFLTSNGTVKLGDFGISKVLEHTQAKALTSVGTPYYMSPEVCENKPYTYKSDIWALGCVLYEMCTLKHAFSADNLLGLVMKIVKEKADPIPSKYSRELQNLVNKLLQKDVKQRYGMSDIFADKFVQKTMQEFIKNEGTNQSMIKIPIKRTPLHEELMKQQKQQQENKEIEDKFELDATCVSIDSPNTDVMVNQLPNPTTLDLLRPYTASKSNLTVAQSKSSPQKATPKATTTKANANAKKASEKNLKICSPYAQLQKKRPDVTKKSQTKQKPAATNDIFVRGVAKLKKNIELPKVGTPILNSSKAKASGNVKKSKPKGQLKKGRPSPVKANAGNKTQNEGVKKDQIQAPVDNLAVSNMSVFENGIKEGPMDLGGTTDTFSLSVTGGFDIDAAKLSTESNENGSHDQEMEDGVIEEADVSAECKEEDTPKKADEESAEKLHIQFEKTGLSEQYKDDFEEYNSEDSDNEDFRITLKANDKELQEVIDLYKDQLNNQHPTFGGLEEISEKAIESSQETFERSLGVQNSILSTAESHIALDPVVLDKKGRVEAMKDKVKQEIGESTYQKIHDYLKEQREKDVRDEEIQKSLTETYGKEILSQCFFIDQILFMETF